MQVSCSFPLGLIVLIIATLQISSISGQIFLSPVGSTCLTSEQCVPNTDCVQNQCICKSGFTLLASLECKMDMGGHCTQTKDCNTAMGLQCVNSICQCSQTLGEEYLFELGSCMNSSMRGMFHQVAGLINQTEFELMRFATLFNMYMIQSTSNGGDSNDIDGVVSGSEINPIVYQRLEQLEQQLFAEQSPIPSVVAFAGTPTPITTTTGGTSQIEPPQTTTVPAAFSLQNFLDAQISGSERRQAQDPPPGVSISISRPIIPSPPPLSEGPPPPPPPPPNNGPFGAFGNFGNFGGNQPNDGPLNGLTSIIPNFIRTFNQFLPFIRSFNNVLSSAILRPFQNLRNNQNAQNLPAPAGPSNIFGGLGSLLGRFFPRPASNTADAVGGVGGGVDLGVGVNGPGVGVNVNVNPDRVRQNLLSLPLRLLQVPGRIFNSFFGPDSALSQLRQRLLPNVDFNRRAFQILPWPLG